MNKIFTSIEQSKKLVQLGLSVDSADAYYSRDKLTYRDIDDRIIPLTEENSSLQLVFNKEESKYLFLYYPEDNCPAWSTDTLLHLMPKSGEMTPNLYFGYWCGEDLLDSWVCECTPKGQNKKAVIGVGATPLEAAYNAFVSLLEKKEIEL